MSTTPDQQSGSESASEVMKRALSQKGSYNENPSLYELAGLGTRFAALVIDSVIYVVIATALSFVVGLVAGSTVRSVQDLQSVQIIATLLSIVFYVAYFAYGLYRGKGQTPGKRIMKIRIINKDGSALSFWNAFLRNIIGYTISSFVFLVGYFWAFTDKNRQTWHDKLASSVVVND